MPGKAITYKKEFEAITKRVETMATKTYKEAYKDADKTKYTSEADFIKAAKAYNQKKYGTTEPTKTAKEKGVSKAELAENKIDKNTPKMDKIKAKPIAPVKPPKAPKAKSAIDKADDAIKAGDAKGAKKAIKDSDYKGKMKRKLKRDAGSEARKVNRSKNNKEKTDKKESIKAAGSRKAARLMDKSDAAKKSESSELEKYNALDMKTTRGKDFAKASKELAKTEQKTDRVGKRLLKEQKKVVEKGQKKDRKKEAKEETMTTRYGGGGESPVAYFRQKIKYNNSAKGIAIRVAADEKDKKHASAKGKKALDHDISSMITNASMKTNTMRYGGSMAEAKHGMPKMKTNQDGGGYAATNPSAPGKQLKKLGSILSKFMHKTK